VRWRHLAAAVGAGTGAVACTGLLAVDDVNYTAAAVDAAAPDRADESADLVDRGTADVQVDSGPADARSPCVGAEHWLCDDFDLAGSVLRPGWSIQTVDASALIAPGEAISPPNALLVTAPPGTQAGIGGTNAISASGLACTFAVLLGTRGDSGAVLAIFELTADDGSSYVLDLTASAAGVDDAFRESVRLADGGTLPIWATRFTLPASTWATVSMSLSLGPRGKMSASVDGFPRILDAHYDVRSMTPPSAQRVAVGALTYPGSAGWSIRVDNAVCDLLP
jgi:hypothetical protein